MLKERAREVGLLVALTDVGLLISAFVLSCILRFKALGHLLGEQNRVFFEPYIWILYVSVPLLLVPLPPGQGSTTRCAARAPWRSSGSP